MSEVYFSRPKNWNIWLLILGCVVIIFVEGRGSGDRKVVYVIIPVLLLILYSEYRIKKLGFDDNNIYLVRFGKTEIVPFERIVKIKLVQRAIQQNMRAEKFRFTYLGESGQKKTCPFRIPTDQVPAWERLKQLIAAANTEVIIDVDGPSWG